MAELIHQHPYATGLWLLSLVVSLRLVIGLWLLSKFAAVPPFKKLRWSCLALLPVVGPLFYGAFFKVPRPHKPGQAAPVNQNALHGAGLHK